jgi:sulfoxide reductase heme-binding subunit YedZ
MAGPVASPAQPAGASRVAAWRPRARVARRVVKTGLFLVALLPAAKLVRDTFDDGLGANPIEEITHRTGFWAITLLTVTLAVTPVRRLLKLNALVQYRRMLGLFAFFYATLHFLIYAADRSVLAGQGLTLADILEDVAKRPYVTVGFAVFLILLSLALTSTNGWIRRLGGKRWQRLHSLIYVAGAGAVLHFLWLVKADIQRPAIFGIILVVLLAARLRWSRRGRARGAA